MKTLLRIFSVLSIALGATNAFAQTCTVDYSLTAPGIYPDTLPSGYVGQPYSEDIQFVLPTDTMGYTFLNFHIVSISLPIGLNWQCSNQANGCNYNPAVSVHGCVNVYGTPLLAGQYPITVTVIADLNIVSGYPVSFESYIEILPPNTSSNNNGFSMTNSTGCVPITVNFTNNNPGLATYSWNFGNGNTSTLENPGPQIYNQPGNYVVQYAGYADNTTVQVYNLTQVTINSISTAFSWGWPTELNPDPYFKIKENGVVIHQSNYIQDAFPPHTWPVSIQMDPAKTYVLEVFDEDDYEIIYGGDDLIGSHTMSLSGCTGCAAGSNSTVSYIVNNILIPPIPSVQSTDTVRVFPYPGVPNIVYDSLAHTLSTDSVQYALQWYFEGTLIPGANAATYLVPQSGNYQVAAISPGGCQTMSASLTAVYCGNTFVPAVNLNGVVLSTPQNAGDSYQWQFNGINIPGATSSSYTAIVNGNYTLVLTNSFGCSYTSGIVNVPVSVNEIAAQERIAVFPNPAMAQINVVLQSPSAIVLLNLMGEVVLQTGVVLQTQIDISSLTSGIYFLRTENGSTVKIVKE
ncbi:MAG: T9SS type A sorting domain-containing protein [Flavobacteriales bacterium]